MAFLKNLKLFGRGKLSGWMRQEDEDDLRPEEEEQPEERRPSWTDDRNSPSFWTEPQEEDREDDAPAGPSAPVAPKKPAQDDSAQDAPDPAEDAPRDADEEDEDAQRHTRVYQQTNWEEWDQAWEREAKRVESSQFRRASSAGQDAPAQGKGKGRKKESAAKTQEKSAPAPTKRAQSDERKSFLHTMCIVLVCGVLFVMVALMVASNFISHPALALPRKIVTAVVTPVQRFFSGITDGVVDYLRLLKVRGNLEYEYNQLLIQLDEYATELAQMEELRFNINSLQEVIGEQDRNRNMNPVTATVIGHDTSNYFSTLTLNVGSSSGVADYMAVVAQGGLVGVTYGVTENKCQVRCIIDSDCTVAGLVQSSRDQGSVKGTLGTNGEPMCRMYYLPDSSLPRPGDVVVTSGVGLEFPKGIPIGYIRESTRGMEDNKSYVVLEPIVDFQHLEYVTVYCYRPSYAEEAQNRISTSSNLRLEIPTTPRPVPTLAIGGASDLLFGQTPSAVETAAPETPTPAPSPAQATPGAATPDPKATPAPENLTYQAADMLGVTPMPSPRPTNTPSPTPVPTPDPGAMTLEDDE